MAAIQEMSLGSYLVDAAVDESVPHGVIRFVPEKFRHPDWLLKMGLTEPIGPYDVNVFGDAFEAVPADGGSGLQETHMPACTAEGVSAESECSADFRTTSLNQPLADFRTTPLSQPMADFRTNKED